MKLSDDDGCVWSCAGIGASLRVSDRETSLSNPSGEHVDRPGV